MILLTMSMKNWSKKIVQKLAKTEIYAFEYVKNAKKATKKEAR